MDINTIITFAGQIGALFGILVSAWRYIVQPAVKITKKIQVTSEELSQALPILLQLSKHYSSNGIFNLPDKLQTIHHLSLLNTEKHKAFGDKMDIAWFEADANGDCIFMSKKYKELCGMTFEQIRGAGWKNAIAQEDRDRVAEAWVKSIADKREFDLKYNFYNPDEDKKIPVHCHAYAAKNEHDQVVGYVGIVMRVEPDADHQPPKSMTLGSVH